MKTTIISLLATAALVTGFATEATASPSNDGATVSRKVAYPDLDLTQPQGARALLHRIRNAAAYVCANGATRPLEYSSRSYRKCVRDASDRAVADVHSSMVTALYTGASGTEVASK